jgi:hypothetical protein
MLVVPSPRGIFESTSPFFKKNQGTHSRNSKQQHGKLEDNPGFARMIDF